LHRLLFAALGSVKAPYCGWENTTAIPGCDFEQIEDQSCQEFSWTRWCAFNRYDREEPKIDAVESYFIYGSLTRQERLPANALTDPDPTPGDWSCMVASLGRQVVWRFIQPKPEEGFALSTGWTSIFPYSRDENHADTTLLFSLENSALATRPGGQLITILGIEGEALTPYLGHFNPSQTYAYYSIRRYFPDVRDWRARFDATNGYLELNHSWWCMDKTPWRRYVFVYFLDYCHLRKFHQNQVLDKRANNLGLYGRYHPQRWF
jgi:hypothetical protein